MNKDELFKKADEKAYQFYNSMSFETKWDFSNVDTDDFESLVTGVYIHAYLQAIKDNENRTK